MARRRVFVFFITAVAFLLLGATGTYLALSIPNDIKAESLLKEARSDLQTGKRDEARTKFAEVVKTYPRTDAAAAASYALFTLLDQERKELAAQLEVVQKERDSLRNEMGNLGKRVSEASRQAQEAAARPPAPPPAPKVTPKAKPKPAPKRTPPRRSTTRRRG